jgi:hypothetical protein
MHVLRGAALMLVLSRAVAAGEGVSQAELRATVDRSLSFLTDEGTEWKEGRKCASCHHAPLMIWALNEAQQQGYAVDRDALRELTAWTLAPDDPAKVFAQKRTEGPERNVRATVLMLALGLQAAGAEDPSYDEGQKRLLTLLQEDQSDDGSWTLPPNARPPTAGGKQLMTSLALLAMTPALPKAPIELKAPAELKAISELKGADHPLSASRQKGLQWLAEAPVDDDLQVTALRLLLATRLDRPRDERQPLITSLIERQNPDGGWGQTRDLSGDGYATGQTLYVLVTAGVDRDAATVRRAQEFLVKGQRKDGSWPMIPRAAEPGGKSSENDGPITYVGTAWATLGLVRSAPVSPEH